MSPISICIISVSLLVNTLVKMSQEACWELWKPMSGFSSILPWVLTKSWPSALLKYLVMFCCNIPLLGPVTMWKYQGVMWWQFARKRALLQPHLCVMTCWCNTQVHGGKISGFKLLNAPSSLNNPNRGPLRRGTVSPPALVSIVPARRKLVWLHTIAVERWWQRIFLLRLSDVGR